jgi:hypothetical protein
MKLAFGEKKKPTTKESKSDDEVQRHQLNAMKITFTKKSKNNLPKDI